MALRPSLSFLRIGSPTAPHTLEFWLDYVCPFSAKLFINALDPIIKPAVTNEDGHLKDRVKVIIRLQVQPWHASSTLTHEAAIAVGRVAPESFWDYTLLLLKRQTEFFDRAVADLTPTEIRKKLVALAGEVPSIDKSKLPTILDHLTYKTTPNGGVDVTDDLKWNVKLGRQNGIHVSPTAIWDGVIQPDVSSSWAQAEWSKFLLDNVKA
ncbi:hypothetical protein BS47DRAFT_1377581 [Hydnum rufescens UP504]|uniref:Thioredoxin-like fold domain-containing protein n=1 Tax=Hydnum rufescens UP504 TaxID=1448309 RepID=A0A9P6AQ29_9AGAM|nr:hypothetical protein BS47DRAFT_1377581 [Hydnum rufescens UP504]